ncbi:MAG: hypothetical protein QW818_01520 [Candidatus Aenigmatarchaeota archaeon]|nr:hypothetical protein [Candidatus Aenigmarchaeota archaeon]
MPTFFETAILKLQSLGFFKFLLPFILTAAIIYGGLRRAQLFGEPEKNVAVNAIVAFVISLFVWAAPIILGIDIESKLSAFFIQGFSVSLIVLIALLLAGMFFPPDLAKNLGERMKTPVFWGGVVIVALIIGGVILISSGLGSVLFPRGIGIKLSSDFVMSVVALIALVAIVAVVVRVAK